MIISATVETPVSTSPRARQLASMFDVPEMSHQSRSWRLTAPIEDRPWHIGLILGPSGAGKTTLLGKFGSGRSLSWDAPSVIDCFDDHLSMRDVAAACGAVGFNTIPAWQRPFKVLSNGEQFRVTLARLLVEAPLQATPLTVVDEFTSVVDRQVAKIGAHAVAKFTRRRDQQLVAASCHEDVIDWLQPDWIIRPDLELFEWREVSPRPKLPSKSPLVNMRSGGGSLPFTI